MLLHVDTKNLFVIGDNLKDRLTPLTQLTIAFVLPFESLHTIVFCW